MGFALNARGAMEIVLALLALQYGVIGEDLFVALVFVALATALMAGPLIQWTLSRKQPATFRRYISSKTFLPELSLSNRQEVIHMLSAAASSATGVNHEVISNHVMHRESVMGTAMPGGLAIPHGRIPSLNQPVVCVGILPKGVDWDAPDGRSTRLAILVLTPPDAHQVQLELLADIASTFSNTQTLNKAIACDQYTCFLAALNTNIPMEHDAPVTAQAEVEVA
jgi:mannitol/fructose-specific phosphotransferase system IIA component (Ntr-type)